MKKQTAENKPRPFLTDVQELRRRARQHMDQGAVTSGYKADRETVIRILNEVLATELVCILRYKRHYYMASGIHSQAVAAERIVQLGGAPNFDPAGLATRSHSEYAEGSSLLEMIREDLVAERIAVESYTEIIRYLGDDDPTTRTMMEKIMSNEEEHAEEMKTLLESLGKDEQRSLGA